MSTKTETYIEPDSTQSLQQAFVSIYYDTIHEEECLDADLLFPFAKLEELVSQHTDADYNIPENIRRINLQKLVDPERAQLDQLRLWRDSGYCGFEQLLVANLAENYIDNIVHRADILDLFFKGAMTDTDSAEINSNFTSDSFNRLLFLISLRYLENISSAYKAYIEKKPKATIYAKEIISYLIDEILITLIYNNPKTYTSIKVANTLKSFLERMPDLKEIIKKQTERELIERSLGYRYVPRRLHNHSEISPQSKGIIYTVKNNASQFIEENPDLDRAEKVTNEVAYRFLIEIEQEISEAKLEKAETPVPYLPYYDHPDNLWIIFTQVMDEIRPFDKSKGTFRTLIDELLFRLYYGLPGIGLTPVEISEVFTVTGIYEVNNKGEVQVSPSTIERRLQELEEKVKNHNDLYPLVFTEFEQVLLLLSNILNYLYSLYECTNTASGGSYSKEEIASMTNKSGATVGSRINGFKRKIETVLVKRRILTL